ncbi:MAG TPA: hypothetical protein DCM14_08100 [Clostridiales bacterium UBA8153]|nr:hypothetical protein [Clostridiales bacterium UBA8153]
MLFLRMALRNARRNLSRSLLALVSMAVAAAILTGTLSMADGYPRGAFWEHRRLAGADVVVYAERAALPGPGSGEKLQWELGMDAHSSDLLQHFPLLGRRGYLALPQVRTFDLAQLPDGFAHQQIAAVEPFLAMPVFVRVPGSADVLPAVLRGRDLDVDRAVWQLAGFTPSDDGALVCLVNRNVPPGWPDFSEHPALVVEVPRVVVHGPAGTIYDYTQRRQFILEVRGVYAFPASVTDAVAQGRDAAEAAEDPGYLPSQQIFVPAGTLERIFEAVGGTGGFRYVHQLGVRVESMVRALEVATYLQERLPWARVFTLPQLVRAAWGQAGQVPVSRDVTRTFTYLAFALAGMLVTTNMFILVTQRRREIGVLKAIGASSGEIVLMVLAETMTLAVLGSVLGFALVRGFYLVVYLASQVSLARVGLDTLRVAAYVIGLGSLTALLAGLVPSVLAARSTAREVLRHE